jgi:hypothetical protein
LDFRDSLPKKANHLNTECETHHENSQLCITTPNG